MPEELNFECVGECRSGLALDSTVSWVEAVEVGVIKPLIARKLEAGLSIFQVKVELSK
jgi:hypothetical protein